MRKKLNRTSVIILIVAALTVAVPSLIVYSYYDRARKSEQLLPAIRLDNTSKALSLLKSGADPNYVGTVYGARRAAIEVACEYRNVVVVRYLLSHGVKPWVAGQDKASLIRRALQDPDKSELPKVSEIIQMLLAHGADVNALDLNGFAPIMLAIEAGQNDFVKFLIDKGADVNPTGGTRYSPLLTATRYGNHFVVRLLLKAGADPAKCDTTFDELIEIAHKGNHKETVAILKDAMAKRKAAGSGGLKK
ncbi:MAG: ankyrin repeat domain-containing protein [Chthonomonadales bacterium]